LTGFIQRANEKMTSSAPETERSMPAMLPAPLSGANMWMQLRTVLTIASTAKIQ
jgi:hypothetical protein